MTGKGSRYKTELGNKGEFNLLSNQTGTVSLCASFFFIFFFIFIAVALPHLSLRKIYAYLGA